jgi:hypothetical protein
MPQPYRHYRNIFHDAFQGIERISLPAASPHAKLVAATHCLAWRNLLWIFQEPTLQAHAYVTTVVTVDTLAPVPVQASKIRHWPPFICPSVQSAGINFRGFWIFTTEATAWCFRAFFPTTLSPPRPRDRNVDFREIGYRYRPKTAWEYINPTCAELAHSFYFEESKPSGALPEASPHRVFLSPPEFDHAIYKAPKSHIKPGKGARLRHKTPDQGEHQGEHQTPTFEDLLGFLWSYTKGHMLTKQPSHLSGPVAHGRSYS